MRPIRQAKLANSGWGGGCALTAEIACAPGATVGALIDAAIVGVGMVAAHEIAKPSDAAPTSAAQDDKSRSAALEPGRTQEIRLPRVVQIEISPLRRGIE